MKTHNKALALVLSLALTLMAVLAGCGKQAEPTYNPDKLALNTISPAVLTEREKVMLGALSGTSYVFDFNADESYGELAIWMERYDFGVLAEERTLNMSGTLRGGGDATEPVRGVIVFSMSPVVEEDGKSGMSTVRVTVSDGNGTSSLNIPPIETPVDMSGVSGSDFARETAIGGETTLAQISYSSAEDGQMAFAADPELNAEFLKDYDLAYILKCEFVKKA